MHALWDFSEDQYHINMNSAKEVYNAAVERSLNIGSVSPTYFLRGSFQGSLSSIRKDVRDRYIDQTVLSAKIVEQYGANLITLWFPDGSSYPAQVDLGEAYTLMKESILEAYQKIKRNVHILIEYKLFEPGIYSTVIPDWGTSYSLVKALGPNAGVLVDLGHHHHGTNIEQIIAVLIREGTRCGLHFNTRYAADDDLAVEPTAELGRIFYELVSGDVLFNKNDALNWFYMIDQCSSRENRIHAILHSVDSLQLSLARALLVNSEAIRDYREKDEILLANRTFNQALIHCDVRPIVYAVRLNKNLPLDVVEAYYESGYQKKIEEERK
jgi:L-rhamnose isomerase/sugar isomerase